MCIRDRASTTSVAVMPGAGLPASSTATISGVRIHVRRVRIGADAGVREGHAVLHVDHRRHLLQVDLMHDPVARRDHVHVLERLLGPFDEVEAVFVAAVFDRAVFFERLRICTAALHRLSLIHI